VQAGLGHTRSSPSDRARVALDAYHFSRRTDQAGCQHCHVSHARAEIQDALTGANACVAEQSFSKRIKTRSLPDEALVFCVRAT